MIGLMNKSVLVVMVGAVLVLSTSFAQAECNYPLSKYVEVQAMVDAELRKAAITECLAQIERDIQDAKDAIQDVLTSSDSPAEKFLALQSQYASLFSRQQTKLDFQNL